MLSQPLASGTPDLKCSRDFFCASVVTFCNVGCRQGHLADVCSTCPPWKGERDSSKGSALCKEHGYKTRSQTQMVKYPSLHKDSRAVPCHWKWLLLLWDLNFCIYFGFPACLVASLVLFSLQGVWCLQPPLSWSLPWDLHDICLSAICGQNDAKIRKGTEHLILTDPGEVWVQIEMCENLDHT